MLKEEFHDFMTYRTGSCDCIDGWSGPHCEVPCSRETCNGHGECIEDICMCDSNYKGEYCETKEFSYSGFIFLLIILNIITAILWYRHAV